MKWWYEETASAPEWGGPWRVSWRGGTEYYATFPKSFLVRFDTLLLFSEAMSVDHRN
jgi:hypothetical protein